jgi:demethylmenaquinone methyltransferase / 2-methoxy-6-polyprenyl-1,4-benzoquinol methylase
VYQQSAPETIQAMFASIAEHYDRANTAFTFGLHKKWNQQLIDALSSSQRLLDVCAGTGEIAFGFLKHNPHAEAILLDFCPEMLAIAQKKGDPFHDRFEMIQADAQAIPLADASVDAVSIAYGIRNVKEPAKCFHEVYRVLASRGRFGILEATRPPSRVMKSGHRLYTRLIVPLLGKMAARNKEAYKYLVNSVETFAAPDAVEASLREAGFRHIHRRPLTGGVAMLFTSIK